jgi:hypothetical protein
VEVGHGGVRFGRQQQLDGLDVPFARSEQQRCLALLVLRVDILAPASVQEAVERVRIVGDGGPVDRPVAEDEVGGVDRHVHVEEEVEHRRVGTLRTPSTRAHTAARPTHAHSGKGRRSEESAHSACRAQQRRHKP